VTACGSGSALMKEMVLIMNWHNFPDKCQPLNGLTIIGTQNQKANTIYKHLNVENVIK
jgi:hypothetical protein